jgi:hypothetical protein
VNPGNTYTSCPSNNLRTIWLAIQAFKKRIKSLCRIVLSRNMVDVMEFAAIFRLVSLILFLAKLHLQSRDFLARSIGFTWIWLVTASFAQFVFLVSDGFEILADLLMNWLTGAILA